MLVVSDNKGRNIKVYHECSSLLLQTLSIAIKLYYSWRKKTYPLLYEFVQIANFSKVEIPSTKLETEWNFGEGGEGVEYHMWMWSFHECCVLI